MAAPPTGQYVPSDFGVYTHPFISTQTLYIPPHFPTSTSMLGLIFGHPSSMYYMPMPSTFSTTTMSMMTYTHTPFVSQTPLGSLFYQGGSSSKPPIPRSKDTRWQSMQSTEGEEDERLKPEPQSEVQPIKNPTRNRRPPRCGIDSNQYLD
ncbi:hypothetical protein Gotri_012725, partial [Gossypium trilobum]|nr:hypothetical protein [Gossypium trilobum]